MSARERNKGSRGEAEVVEMIRVHWPRATRNFASGAAGNGDIAHGPANTSIEVKRTERAEPWKWWEQAERDADGRMPVVAFRRSRAPWLAIVELDELLALLAHRERG